MLSQVSTLFFCSFSFSLLGLYRFCPSQICLSSPFWGVLVVQTVDSLVVQLTEKQAVVFWKTPKKWTAGCHWSESTPLCKFLLLKMSGFFFVRTKVRVFKSTLLDNISVLKNQNLFTSQKKNWPNAGGATFLYIRWQSTVMMKRTLHLKHSALTPDLWLQC